MIGIWAAPSPHAINGRNISAAYACTARSGGTYRRHPGLEPGPALFLTATMEKLPCVYILAKASHGTLYTGVTSDLPARVWQHREGSFAASPNATE